MQPAQFLMCEISTVVLILDKLVLQELTLVSRLVGWFVVQIQLQLVCELPFINVNCEYTNNGYLKVQLRCFVANLNIDGFTRFLC